MNEPNILQPGQSPQAAAVVRNAFANMGASGPRTLISVYPLALELELRHEGTKTYRIEAAPEGGHSELVVEDTFASCKNFMSNQMYPAPVPAAVVADNLLHAWTQGRVGTAGGLGPGVLVCSGPKPTQGEIDACRNRQKEYFRFLINDADIKFTKEGMLNITDDARMAAEWMGVKDRKWAQKIEPAHNVKCPACKEEIMSDANVCKHCGRDIEEYVAKQTAKHAVKKV